MLIVWIPIFIFTLLTGNRGKKRSRNTVRFDAEKVGYNVNGLESFSE